MTVAIDVSELKEQLAGNNPPVLLDVRWSLGDSEGRRHYREAHIPGAVFVDLDTELASHGEPSDGRHPLPDVADLQNAARSWGIGADSRVVAYDNSGNLAAARAWWLLKWAGLTDVVLLDGGLAAWTAAGFDTAPGDEIPAPGDVELTAGHLPTLTADDVENYSGTLLDARAPERYSGETEPIDPKAGHIPGAVSAPTGANIDADGRFLAADALRERFAFAGEDVAVYCGSGVTAAHQIAALAIAGVDATLYPGSWSQWSNQPNRPVATGPSPR
ncbi:sulfurtransferase [Rhodococcus sp. Eu-32]|uniref:sulfurtransferase n=1 Tax=Rhodococcus sp. Eu-32 TaxID=1017319 RepID=UPI000DF3EB83|nr:sulfurtransferase [Rhodococcus sp. Eu-32]RRQ29413.1 sulfurtransferase [Rhodococcus sp. Eu-32]